MAKFTVNPDGSIGTDSPQAALELQRAILGKKTRGPTSGSASTVQDAPNPKVKIFVAALLKSAKGLTSEQAAQVIGIGLKSLPPVVRSLNAWCKHHKVNFEGMIKRTNQYDNRRVISLYSLTDDGRLFFAARAEFLTVATNGAGSKTAEA